MRKGDWMLKWLLGLGLIVLIASGVGVYYIYSNLEELVEQAIEQVGSDAVGVAVRVDRVELDLEAGRASIFGLSVANPTGYEGPNAFTLAELTVDIDLESLADRDPIVLDKIRIDSPVVFYEANAEGKSNLEVLADNASGESASSGNDAETSGEGAGDAEPPLRLSIRKIRFTGGRVEADTRAIGGNRMEAELPKAKLKNVGGEKGATGAELGSIIVEELGRQALLAIGHDQLDKVLKDQIGEENAGAVKGLLKAFGR
jgi:hypothetical protein